MKTINASIDGVLVVVFEWQPIETAPRDGTELLLYQQEAGIQVSWWGHDPDNQDTGWVGSVPEPTHWMPLPEPPINRGDI